MSVSESLSLPPRQSKPSPACPSLCHCQCHSATQMKGPADKFLIFLPEYLFVTISVTLSDLPPKANPADSTFVFLLAYLCHYQCHCHSDKENPADNTFVFFLCISVIINVTRTKQALLPVCLICMQQPIFVWSVSLTNSPQQQDI